MNHDWNADILLTQHFETPIRFYLHEGSVDLMDITMHIHNRVHSVDHKGKHHLLHKKDILFAIPVAKIKEVKNRIKMFSPVKSLKINRKSVIQQHFDVGDSKLESVIGNNITIVTRRGHVIRGELKIFDKDHLFMQVGKEIVLIYRNGLFGFKEEIEDALKHNRNLHDLQNIRKKWVEANRENDFEDGIKNLLTDLYPDNAHFTYELLQNAEDAGASKVQFDLYTDRLEFEHNGDCLFDIEDITSITSIGVSTKRDDPTSIGKFGIGFKAVFAYTATPEIESGEFHFRIRDMVVPDTKGLFPGLLGKNKTRFVFPFDNPEKPSKKARAEIETKLRQLNENTLLFLSNIRKIEYHLPDSTTGSLERRENKNDENQIEIAVTRPGNIVPDSTHYLRFQGEVDVRDEETSELKHCQIAVAFGMDRPRSQGGKIVSLNPGQVCIYFPAESETSKLRFHLHAPFASTVARASIRRDSAANEKLRDHLADLVAESMEDIRDKGLLDAEFLATLPNNSDALSLFYQPIQEQLVKEFKSKRLVPMAKGGYAISSECYKDQRNLSDLINDEDLATLLEKDISLPLWIENPLSPRRRNERGQFVQDENARQQNERISNFHTMLGISEWEIGNLIEVLSAHSDTVLDWLGGKQDEWHQHLYVLLGNFLSRAQSYTYSTAREHREKLLNLRIVLCSDREYRIGSECHFLGDDMEPDKDLFSVSRVLEDQGLPEFPEKEEEKEDFHYVASAVYSSGNNESQQENARKFLESIGVRKVDDAERIKIILRHRYTTGSIKPREGDIEKFIIFVRDQPEKRSLFKDYFIFQIDLERDDSKWFCKPSGVYIDSPYLDTGLNVYHSALEEDSDFFKHALSPNYVESGIDLDSIGEFAAAVGAKTKLEIIEQKISLEHPEYEYLVSNAPGQYRSDTCINIDYTIAEFRILLDTPSVDKSKLIWRTMTDSLSTDHLQALYRNNRSQSERVGVSTLVYELRKAEWVPQRNGESLSFVRPIRASIDLLPKDFRYEPGQEWLKAIEFGEIAKFQKEESTRRNQHAKELGFGSEDEAKRAAEFFKEQGKTPNQLLNKLHAQKRRKELLIIELGDTEEKSYEIRARSVKTTANTIDPRTSLRELYTTDENRTHCQMCSKGMPFKKRNSEEDYFEAVEALGKDYFFKEHEAQYLALCPECAAEYKEYVKKYPKARETFHDALKNSDSPQIHLESHGRTIHIWFEDKHWQDLKTVLYYYENLYNPDSAD